MAAKKAAFSTASPNFWASLLTFALSVAALGGVNWGIEPALLSGKIITSLQGGSLWAAVGIIIANVATPLYYVIRNKSFKLSLRNVNFWIQVATLALTGGVVLGIAFDVSAASSIVSAVAAKDYAALITIASAAVLNPLVRFIKDKIKKDEL